VHLVTVLEEMPVQETVDAAGELAAAGLPIGSIVVNRSRPALIPDGLVGADGEVDRDLLSAGLLKVGVPVGHADALIAELRGYAERQRLEACTVAQLETVAAPQIKLPDLNPPVELGELKQLAARFVRGTG
jgi:hypothetical protein